MKYLHFILLAFISCLYVSCIPIVQAPPPVLPWYQPQPLSPLPPVSLAGKIILIDPGHGNAASGAIGAGGAKEKDINLAVARYLKTLLVNQGASVYMTREADTSTLWPMNLSSREDLHKRCLYRDSLVPDLFVSIHHNGSEDGLIDVNSAKTFYAMGDAGASLDAARFINMEFTEVLGLGQSELLCGNYFVLRNSKVPTLLGEPSYLSNPVMERILCDSSAQKLEATAYFRGIVKWFSLGVLKITGFSIDSVRGSVTATIWSEATLDPLLTGIFLDQNRLNGKISKNGYTAAIPLPLKNGIHTFKCSAGNVSGNLATSATFSYTVDRPAETLIAAVENESVSFLAPLRITALDSYGYPVRDGTQVLLKDKDVAYTEDGVALFYVSAADSAQIVDISCGNATIYPPIPYSVDSLPPFQGFISSTDTKFRPQTSLISIAGTNYAPDRNGFFSIATADTSTEITAAFMAAGFLETSGVLTRAKVNTIKLTPRMQGVLIGKKIIIDPEFGGAETGGISVNGIRASDVSRKIAYTVAGLLEEYGVDVCFARAEDRTIHATERVVTSENFGAEIYLIIRTDSLQEKPYVSHFKGSKLGKKIAGKLVQEWYKVSGDSAAVLEELSFVMQQTQCPAVTLSFSPLNLPDLLDHKNSRKIAEVVSNGLIDFYLEN